MHIYQEIYEFAASAGAFEGFVYPKKNGSLNPDDLPNWINNLVAAYQHLPDEAKNEFQFSIDQTLGRALRALIPILGEDHDTIIKLQSMIAGPMPKTANDFQKKKHFQK
jgi:hypothetical protein